MFANDLKRHPAAAKVLTAARARYERDGVPRTERYDCDPDHPSGTRLPGCVKVYLPKPGGHWRMVFQIELLLNRVPGLVYLAAASATPRARVAAWTSISSPTTVCTESGRRASVEASA